MPGLEGGCPCRKIRYQLRDEPMMIHCCHCTWCQKETGSAFALNMMIETSKVQCPSESLLEIIDNPSESGSGQRMARCPSCRVCMWSNYGDTGDKIRFVRAGTLDNPGQIRPAVHIYTATKLPWVQLDDTIPAMPEFYKRDEFWPKESLDRYNKARYGA